MNKFLKVLGGIFLALLVVIAIAAAIFIPKSMALNKDATTYIEANVPLIVANWDPEELKKRADPELLATIGKDELPKMFLWLSSIGKLKKLEQPFGQIGTGVYAGTNTSGTWGNFVAKAEFETGPAQINIVLRRSGESWKILGFHVNSKALLPKQDQLQQRPPA